MQLAMVCAAGSPLAAPKQKPTAKSQVHGTDIDAT